MGAIRTSFLFISLQLISMISSQELYKRMPQGFVGMRGKKYVDDNAEQFYKRKPQFFVGVKGKKNFYDYMENPETYFKRAPMGFMGVRGKKETMFPESNYYPQNYEYALKRDGSLIGQIDYKSNENANDPEFPILNEILNEYLQKLERPSTEAEGNETSEENERITNDENERITNEVDKRAANIHQFFGVRGKKSIQNKRPYDLSFRGKFIGVRGKKDLKNSNPQEIKFLLSAPFPKRKGQMGFFGMRGKKWIDESSPEVETSN